MIKDTEMLNHIRQNSEMGIDGIKTVLKHSEDGALCAALESQMEEYEQIFNEADRLLREQGGESEDINPALKTMTKMSGAVKNLVGQTTEKIADDMIKGNTMGVTKIIKHMNDYSGDNIEIKKLADKLLKTEQSNIEQMKKFL